MASYSIFQFLSEGSSQDCGYCSGSDSGTSAGMWAHRLSVDDYQALTNRNWRRSGCYCYHPWSDRTCCPPYMIRCGVLDFTLSKHQKKVIKKFNRYMMTGSVSETSECQVPAVSSHSSASGDNVKQVAKGLGADPSKPKAIKAKQLRAQRKQEKLQKKPDSGVPQESMSSAAKNSQDKSLHDLLGEYDVNTAKHKFELRLVRSHPASREFTETLEEEHQVYQRYQMAIHKDPKSKVNMQQFQRFLVDSPLIETKRSGVELGSFHYQYIVDGKIIAVEVMDILPECVSSKYVFYDPAYDFLTLGSYSTFRSIYLIQKMQKSLTSLQYYLMGYYIHDCQKMRYKGSFSPSFLLCPETYKWTPIEQCRPLLDAKKYSRLCVLPGEEDADKAKGDDYTHTNCLRDNSIYDYQTFKVMHRRQNSVRRDSQVKLYTELVGKALSTKALLLMD